MVDTSPRCPHCDISVDEKIPRPLVTKVGIRPNDLLSRYRGMYQRHGGSDEFCSASALAENALKAG